MNHLFSTDKKTKLIFTLLLTTAIGLLILWLLAQRLSNRHQQLSVKPPSQFSSITLTPVESIIGLNIRLPYVTLIDATEQATAEPQIGEGQKQTCKKIIGVKACATLLWQYRIERSGKVKIDRVDDHLQLRLPLSLDGRVTVDGRGGKLLGLRNKNINGQLELIADLKVSVAENWCPEIITDLNYRWHSDPKINLVGNLKINLRKSADKALTRKLSKLEQQFTNLIDCSEFRTRVAKNWKVHQLPIRIPGQLQSYLEVNPQSVAVSQAQPLEDHLSVAFEIVAKTQVVDHQSPQDPLVLPDILRQVGIPGMVEFSLLFNLSYDQLGKMVSDKLVKSTAQSENERFTITSFDVYPSGSKLIFDVGFKARGIGPFFQTSGNLYLSAKPVTDPDLKQLRFDELQFTRIIDNDFWSAFSTILHSRILKTLQDSAVIDLTPQLDKLEESIANTLADPTKTAGLIVQSSAPEVSLNTVNPQADSLAAIIHVSTRLQVEVPPEVLVRK